eukprot:Trichotokara_eunicae@DN2532_c0_g1_i1.p1
MLEEGFLNFGETPYAKEDERNAADEAEYQRLSGIVMIAMGVLLSVTYTYVLLFDLPFVKAANNDDVIRKTESFVRMFQADPTRFLLFDYYALLLPAFVPIIVFYMYWNWLSMKFFRHN